MRINIYWTKGEQTELISCLSISHCGHNVHYFHCSHRCWWMLDEHFFEMSYGDCGYNGHNGHLNDWSHFIIFVITIIQYGHQDQSMASISSSFFLISYTELHKWYTVMTSIFENDLITNIFKKDITRVIVMLVVFVYLKWFWSLKLIMS